MPRPKNPLSFSCNEIAGFDFFHDLGKKSYVFHDDVVSGERYLKMVVRYVERSHNDESDACSLYGFDENEENEEYALDPVELTVYFKIPTDWCDTEGRLRDEYMDDEWELKKDHEDTENMYTSWKAHAWCNGSGYCNLHDSYEVKSITYVMIT
jgi:hypothetical protein